MRFNMISTLRKLDKELMYEIGEIIVVLVRNGKIELAESYGEKYQALDEKIKTHDYSKEDELITSADERIDEFYRNYEKNTT